jgi:hypothetical protein
MPFYLYFIQQNLNWADMAKKAVTPPILPPSINTDEITGHGQFSEEHFQWKFLKLWKYRTPFKVRKCTLSDVLVCGA